MRFRVDIGLKTEEFPLDYRPMIISLFKNSLTVYEKGKHYDEFYGHNSINPFSFAVNIPGGKFTKNSICITNKKINITFSTSDIGVGITFFNALLMQKQKKYPLEHNNVLTIKNVVIEKEIPIISNSIKVTFKSPLCVRKHNKKNNSDIYYSYEKEGFTEALMEVLKLQLENSKVLPVSMLDNFSIEPIKYKKTVVKHHKQYIESSIGQFRLNGEIALLNYLYTDGMASRKSSGFGLMEIIREDVQ